MRQFICLLTIWVGFQACPADSVEHNRSRRGITESRTQAVLDQILGPGRTNVWICTSREVSTAEEVSIRFWNPTVAFVDRFEQRGRRNRANVSKQNLVSRSIRRIRHAPRTRRVSGALIVDAEPDLQEVTRIVRGLMGYVEGRDFLHVTRRFDRR